MISSHFHNIEHHALVEYHGLTDHLKLAFVYAHSLAHIPFFMVLDNLII